MVGGSRGEEVRRGCNEGLGGGGVLGYSTSTGVVPDQNHS